MADQQIARLNQQIQEYNNRTEIEKRRHDEFSKKVREYFDEKQRLTQNSGQENTQDLKIEFQEDMKQLQNGYAFLEYERFKQEIGDIKMPSDRDNLLNTAASFLIQFDEPMPRLINQREQIINRCKKLANEISALQKDIQPISQQAEDEIRESRKQLLSYQNKINYLQIDRINKRLQHFSNRYKRETEISKIEGQIASSQTTYAYQKAALNGLQYVSLLLKDGKDFTPDQVKQIKEHIDSFNKLFKFKDKDQYEKKLSKTTKAAKKLNKVRKEATSKINEVLSGFSQICQLELSVNKEINDIKTITNLNELENYGVINELKRLTSLNNSLDTENAKLDEEVNEHAAENAKLSEEIQKSEEYRGKTLQDMNLIEKQLKEKQERKEKLLKEHKTLEDEYQKSSDDFLKAISEIAKANQTPEAQKSSEELTSKIKSIKTRIKDVRMFEDVEKPKSIFILDEIKHDLEEIKKSTETPKIENIQFIYYTQPNGMFSVMRVPTLQYYIVKTAHAKLAFDALFYPENLDKMYSRTLITATLLGQKRDMQLLASSIIKLIKNSIKSNLKNIDPNTQGAHSPQEMVNSFDKAHPYQFSKLIPYISTKPLTLKDFLIRSLTFLINIIRIHPVNEAIKNDVKSLLALVDEKLTDPKEYSATLKNLLNLNIDPKAAKKKKAASNKKADDQNISNENANTEEIINEKDRKQDIPIEKVNMSLKEKDLDHISYLDTRIISDNDFYNLFTYIQFNLFHKIAAVDLILKYQPNKPKSSAYVEDMINLQLNTARFVKAQLAQSQGGRGGKADDVLVSLKRWMRIAEIALRNNNIFFFQIIVDSLIAVTSKTDFSKDKDTSLKLNELVSFYNDETEVSSKLSEIRKLYNDKSSQSLNPKWFYIPSFNDKISSINRIKELLSQEQSYAVTDNILQMKNIREIADQLYFSLSSINSKISFKLNPDLVRALEKKLTLSAEG